MPTFLECVFCRRLYSQHSLAIHEKGCLESTSKTPSTTPSRGRSKSGKRRKSAVDRPRTRSMSRIAIENDSLRICFVCGEQFDEDVIVKHKKECLEDWSSLAETLSTRFHIHPPKILNVPSIDGTIDIGRENQKAIQSSQNCQLVRCRGCNARIAIQHAESHICVRFEPTIEFYF